MKQVNVKPALLVATTLAYSALASVDCAGGEAAHAKLARSASAVATERRSPRAVGRGAVSHKAGTRSSVVRSKSLSRRHLAVKQDRKSRTAAKRQAGHGKNHERLASAQGSARTRIAMLGLASFYADDSMTASGETFDRHRLNAAHPSMPFGTRLRVTNVRNGRSVTVRVNDRGPFVGGRVVDVTMAAAEALGMVDDGVAKVTLEIVR